MTISGQLVK
ncbi:hypothetical protein R3I94_021802 [Phoxinus phoxinus]